MCYSHIGGMLFMDEMTSRVKFEGDNGESFEMIVLKEFDYKKRRFAVLMEDGCNCHCNDDSCTCNHEGKEDKCTCDECDCDECDCDDNGLYILEVAMDEYGNEVFKPIEYEKLFDEVIEKADKVLYETN